MRGAAEVHGRNWFELARVPAPVGVRSLWRAILDKTEHPERYDARVRGAEVLDQDATLVVRRTRPARGEPYIEWITHARAQGRVETRRRGESWLRAQAVVETSRGPHVVYLVDDPDAAARRAGIDAAHARRVLDRLVQAAGSRAPRA